MDTGMGADGIHRAGGRRPNRFDTNADGWDGPGGPQDLFFTRDEEWPYPRVVRADNIYLYDENGSRYIDASSGPIASNLGHNNRRVIEAMKVQLDKLPFNTIRLARSDENIALAARLAEFAGKGFERPFFVSGGSEANEVAVQFARQWAWAHGQTERKRLFSLMPSYHGGTIFAQMLSGDEAVAPIFAGMAATPERIEAPLSYRPPPGLTHEQNEDRICEQFEARILEVGADTCLALFMEPVGGLATGANVLSGRFLRRMREICTKYGLLMILDEVMSGAGRSGKFLTTQHHGEDCKPDLVVLAKGIGSGYIPLGIMLAPAAMVDELSGLSGFNYGHTSNANPLACAVGLATLEELEERKLMENASETGAYLKQRMTALSEGCPIIGDVRGLGLLQATELVANKETKEIFSADVKAPDTLRRMGLDFGLSLYARRTNNGKYGDWVMTSPPLITTREQVDEMVDLFGQLFTAFADKLVRGGAKVA